MTELVQYGGAAFTAQCPECGDKVEPADELSVNEFMQDEIKDRPHTADAKCKNCGNVKIEFAGFESDL